METFIKHIIEASVCLTLFYIIYILLLRKDTGFRAIRFYLLASILVSMLLPFNKFAINIALPVQNHIIQKVEKPVQKQSNYEKNDFQIKDDIQSKSSSLAVKSLNYFQLVINIYFVILIILLTRLTIGFSIILIHYLSATKEKYRNYQIIRNEKLKNSFSFLNVIFINPKDLTENELQGIVTHENIHVSQYHTIDLILIELISAVMWFNPFVWLLRKSLRQIHEYLADEGVLNIGFDRLEYQALLINQVAESRLLSLASSFNKSQIKNRIQMMTKLNSSNRTKLKILALVPISVLLLFSIACLNGQNKSAAKDTTALMPPLPPPPPVPPSENWAAVAPTKMNVLYIGVDNPVDISVSGQQTDNLEVKIDNGTINGSSGQYIVKPNNPGKAVITVFANGKKVKESQFRVKTVPDPVAKIAGKRSGSISKAELLKQTEVYSEMENFEFDLTFKVVEFSVAMVLDGYSLEKKSKSNKITDEQKNMIQKCLAGQKIYIENIKAVGPDGAIRQLGAIALTIE